jgi:hypothetical protein
MILWSDILTELLKKGINPYDIDVRYLQKWIRLYPELFPKFIIENKYELKFNYDFLQWEIYEIKI